MKILFALITTAGLLLSGTISIAADSIMIPEKSAWARATPPGSKTTAIYLTLMNHSDSDIGLTTATANISDRVELHTHKNEDGLMKMQQVSSITIPAGGQAHLKPHGDHIMVFNLQEQLKAGKEVKVELTFDDNSTQTLTIPVFKESPTGSDDSGHSMKHEHKKDKDSETKHTHSTSDS